VSLFFDITYSCHSGSWAVVFGGDETLNSSRMQKYVEKMMGTVLLAFGIKVAFSITS